MSSGILYKWVKFHENKIVMHGEGDNKNWKKEKVVILEFDKPTSQAYIPKDLKSITDVCCSNFTLKPSWRKGTRADILDSKTESHSCMWHTSWTWLQPYHISS